MRLRYLHHAWSCAQAITTMAAHSVYCRFESSAAAVLPCCCPFNGRGLAAKPFFLPLEYVRLSSPFDCRPCPVNGEHLTHTVGTLPHRRGHLSSWPPQEPCGSLASNLDTAISSYSRMTGAMCEQFAALPLDTPWAAWRRMLKALRLPLESRTARRLEAEGNRCLHEPWAKIPPGADVLIDCVEGGASVSFMLPISHNTALAFWRNRR